MTGWKAYLGVALLIIDGLSAVLHQIVGTPAVSPEVRQSVALVGAGMSVWGIRHKIERTAGPDPEQKKSMVSQAVKAVTP